MNLFAYIDPGSGSLLFQLLLAGALTMGYVVRSNYMYVKARFRRTGGTDA